MKINQLLAVFGMITALFLSAGIVSAQDDNGGNKDGGGNGGGRRGNFDPAQMQQRMMERYQEQLGFTNDTEWDAVKPLVQKVMEAQMAERSGQMRGMFGGGRNRGGNNGDQANNRPRGGIGSMFGQPSPEADALQKAIDDSASASQIKDLLAKYKASQKAKQAKLEAAQADLQAVLSTKQEAQATLMGLLQ